MMSWFKKEKHTHKQAYTQTYIQKHTQHTQKTTKQSRNKNNNNKMKQKSIIK